MKMMHLPLEIFSWTDDFIVIQKGNRHLMLGGDLREQHNQDGNEVIYMI